MDGLNQYLRLASARFSQQDPIFLPGDGKGMVTLLFAISFGSESARTRWLTVAATGVEIFHGDG